MIDNQHIPSGYKPSPLGIIPEDWEVKRLGEIFTFKNGVNAGKDSYGEGVRFVNTMDVLNNEYITGKILRGRVAINEKTKNEFLVSFGDVLFNRTSETREEVGCSTVYLDNEDAVFGGFVIRAHDIDAIILNPRFKQYCFQPSYIRNQISALGNGAIRYNLGQEDLSKVNLLIPTKVEQEAIVSVISLWDTAIAKQTALIEQLTLRKRGLMQQLLTGKKRLKGFEGEWKELRLGEIGMFLSNNTLSRDQLNTEKGEVQNVHYGDVLIKYPSILDCSKTVLPFINESAYKDSMTDYVKDGDIIISDTAEDETVGKACEIQKLGNKKVLAGLHTMLLRPKDGVFAPFFLGYYFNSEKYHSKLLPLIQGIKVCSIGKQAIQNTIIEVPSIKEQTAIASVLVNADKEIEIQKQKLAAMQEEKKGLMQVLLTGKRRIV